MSSPYKKLKTTNKQWIGYINLYKLTPNKAYRIDKIVPTKHPEFGPGEQAYVTGTKGDKWRTQLPNKYLANLSSDELEVMKRDACEKRNPYLIYREKMPDGSYRIDIVEKCPENDQKFLNGEDIDELDDSIKSDQEVNEENDITKSDQPLNKGNDDSTKSDQQVDKENEDSTKSDQPVNEENSDLKG